MNTFKQLIECIEDNNRINDAKWNDWLGYDAVLEVYGPLRDEDIDDNDASRIITRAIASNRATLSGDLRELGIRIYGHEFAGPSFWFRGEV